MVEEGSLWNTCGLGDAFNRRYAVATLVKHFDAGAQDVAPAAMTWVLPSGIDVEAASAVPVAFATASECLLR